MPQIVPLGGEVNWPHNEGILGIVGVAPWATLDFCRVLYHEIQATKDWHYPRLIVDINTKIPSRGRHFELGETDPSSAIAETIVELHRQGATVAVVPCNTVHILYDRWAKSSPIPIPNIIDETLKLAATGGARRVAALVSLSMFSFDLYGNTASRHGLENCPLDHTCKELVSVMIQTIKISAQLGGDGQFQLDTLVAFLRSQEVDTVLLGCTELTVLAPDLRRRGFITVDSNQALARAALKLLNMPPGCHSVTESAL